MLDQGMMYGNKEIIMDWIQVLTIISVLGGLMIYLIQKIDSDVKSLGNRLDGHAMRIDQLYKMFVDLLKERK